MTVSLPEPVICELCHFRLCHHTIGVVNPVQLLQVVGLCVQYLIITVTDQMTITISQAVIINPH